MTAPLVGRLRAQLRTAMNARDRDLVAALRSTLSAIDNASSEGVEAPRAGAIEASAAGAGAAEAPRRELTEEDIEALVRSEIAEREAAAVALETAGQTERAGVMREVTARLVAAIRPE
ncbi:hypothetical protein ATK17_1311 [Branchiibius hedensis]|uniref:GatB/YqeY domain-containing protein n=1 Tax=Branchiibius hedensis TaxID=672460 RepID=A0A2Y9BTG4_9MICO|nr:hypothetical protein [Branchiibius hedensis]PWJ25197.1 hypothetical protein ATK17_1311 [Branchiibius hedensis]SSA34012.1 hypothetical protein SAMN04489750_1311 [Branchiibius hedensis]